MIQLLNTTINDGSQVVFPLFLAGKGGAQPLRTSTDAAAWAAAAELHSLLGNDDLAQAAFVGHVARCAPGLLNSAPGLQSLPSPQPSP